MPGTPETILAFDFGSRRIGLAVGQQVTESANPRGVVANGDNGPDWDKIEAIVREWRPARLIVGLPLHKDGSDSETTTLVRSFANDLLRFGLTVESVDERYTSVEAQSLLKNARAHGSRGRIRKDMIDSAAATLIAERWLKKSHQ